MKKISANAIDNHSRTIFPVAYAIFNVVYWFYYLYPNNNWTADQLLKSLK